MLENELGKDGECINPVKCLLKRNFYLFLLIFGQVCFKSLLLFVTFEKYLSCGTFDCY